MFGMAAFAFEGAGVVIPTECSMKKPELFNKVIWYFNLQLFKAEGSYKPVKIKESVYQTLFASRA